MKLFTRYSRVTIAATIIIFLISSIAFSFLLRYVILNQVDDDLQIEKHEIITYTNQFNKLPAVIEVHDQYITYKQMSANTQSRDKIYTEKSYDGGVREKELMRTIQFRINVNGIFYLVKVSKSLDDTEDLIQTIIIITIAVILLILAVTFIINRILLRKLWKPFYKTIDTVQQFRLSNTKLEELDNTNIEEFTLLNSILHETLNKAQQDYKSLKEFTENASHELQTPLAVIQSKLDLLIQSDKLTENESLAIQSCYQSIQNLKRLNQSLLLLAKIDNRQFSEVAGIEVKPLLQNKIKQFEELWKNKNIYFETDSADATISGNAELIDILLNNLLSNATKYNFEGGKITIELKPGLLIINNTGDANAIDNKLLFKRFSKSTSLTESYGLGLSIIQQICIESGYECKYDFIQPNIHSLGICW